MPSSRKRTKVPGSNKEVLPNSQVVGEVNPLERIEITVLLRPRSFAGKNQAHTAANDRIEGRQPLRKLKTSGSHTAPADDLPQSPRATANFPTAAVPRRSRV